MSHKLIVRLNQSVLNSDLFSLIISFSGIFIAVFITALNFIAFLTMESLNVDKCYGLPNACLLKALIELFTHNLFLI